MRTLIALATLLVGISTAQGNLALETSAPVRTIVRIEPLARDAGSVEPAWTLLLVGVAKWGLGDDRAVPLRPYPGVSELPDNRHGVHLVAVQTPRLAAFHKAVQTEVARSTPTGKTPAAADSTQGRLERFVAVRTIVTENPTWSAITAAPLGGRRDRDATDPTRVIRESYRITGIGGGTIHVKQISRRLFDVAGKEIAPAEAEQSQAGANRLLLGLAFLGLLGLFGVILRRLRARPSRVRTPTAT